MNWLIQLLDVFNEVAPLEIWPLSFLFPSPTSIGVGFSLTANAAGSSWHSSGASKCGAGLEPCTAEGCKEKKVQKAFAHHSHKLGSSESNAT